MGKEKIIGALIFIIALLVLVYYTWGLLLLYIFPTLADVVPAGWEWLLAPDPMILIILPIWAAAVLIMIIAMWIGWTMLTTPAPEPLEDFDFDEESIAPEKREE
ncbi:MAG: hypothetical protein P1Q69_09030 [Candidatus Thorarchaeota archaeon]|nr:hypothetical protein [Candidatus Thorarchaeota archaeon]